MLNCFRFGNGVFIRVFKIIIIGTFKHDKKSFQSVKNTVFFIKYFKSTGHHLFLQV